MQRYLARRGLHLTRRGWIVLYVVAFVAGLEAIDLTVALLAHLLGVPIADGG